MDSEIIIIDHRAIHKYRFKLGCCLLCTKAYVAKWKTFLWSDELKFEILFEKHVLHTTVAFWLSYLVDSKARPNRQKHTVQAIL